MWAGFPAAWTLPGRINAALDDTFTFRDKTVSVRWMWQHLVEEYARHNGHADLLREAIDGSVGT